MAQPWAGILPVELPFSGTTDASGNYSFETQIRAAFWSVVKVTCLATGNPIWLVEVGGNVAAPGIGPQADLGPVIAAPGEKVKITVSNATPQSTIRGNFSGVQAPDLQTIAGMYAPTPNTVSLQQSAQQVLLDKITVTTNNQSITHNAIVVPPGTHSLAVVTDIPSNLASIVVQGAVSQLFYINAAIPQPAFPVYSTILSVLDSTVNWSVLATFAGITGPTNVWLIAILDPLVVVANLSQSPTPVMSLVSSSGFPIEADNTLSGGGNPLRLGVSMSDSKAAPWQAPSAFIDATRNTTGITSLVTGIANKTVYVFGWWLQEDLGTANSIGFLEDSTGLRLGGVIAATGAAAVTGYHGGLALAVGRGLQMNAAIVGAGPANLRCAVSYSGPV